MAARHCTQTFRTPDQKDTQVKIYNVDNTFYSTKKEAIEAAQDIAAPKWSNEEDTFLMDAPDGVGISVIELSNLGQAVTILNGFSPKPIGLITVFADMSIRDIKTPNAQITFTTKREVFDD